MTKRERVAALLGSSLLLAAWTGSHLELVSSFPKQDQTAAAPPVDISLVFSESADSASARVSLKGPQGEVPLGPIRAQDESLVLLARVEGPMAGGAYTVSWTAAGSDGGPVSWHFRFTLR